MRVNVAKYSQQHAAFITHLESMHLGGVLPNNNNKLITDIYRDRVVHLEPIAKIQPTSARLANAAARTIVLLIANDRSGILSLAD